MPQGVVPPAVTFSIDGDLPQRLTSGEASSLRTALVSVDCWAISVVAAHRLADAVEACLLPVHGAMGAEVPPQLVDDVQLERRFDLFETDSKLYRVSLQFSVAYYP